jgi:hypothetical protein
MPSYHTVKHIRELASIARDMEREAVTHDDWRVLNRLAAEYEALADYLQAMTARQCHRLVRKWRSEKDRESAPPRRASAAASGSHLSLVRLRGRQAD